MPATVTILFEGYTRLTGPGVASTVGLVREGDVSLVIDPGMVPARSAILDPLRAGGLEPEDITDVVFSHHHPDHTLNAALFPKARFHDHWAIYRGDVWEDSEAEGRRLSPSTSLLETPGHTTQDISTLVEAEQGLVVFTHLWWFAEGPARDPTAVDPNALHRSWERVLDLSPALIVPGHGAAFAPGAETPR